MNDSTNTYRIPALIPYLIIAILFLIIGLVASQFLPENLLPQSPSQKAKAAQLKLLERMVLDPQQRWNSLVETSYAEFTVGGQVIKIEDGTGGPAERQGAGKILTLRKGSNEAKFFVLRESDWRQGVLTDWASWRSMKADDLAVGDIVSLYTHAPLNQMSTINSFFGWWVFRHNSAQ